MAEQTEMVLSPTARPAARTTPRSLPTGPGPRPRRRRLRQPGWPLTYLLTGYPLWWLLGLTDAFLLFATVVMAVQLARTRRVSARPGFGWWLLFLCWVCVGIVLLQVDAPGAQSGASSGRYVTFIFRLCLYLAATIVLVYIYDFRSRITTERLLRSFSWFFVTVVAGGVLGATAPYLDIPSAMELVLPHSISHVQFVHSLIHPFVAQVVDPAHPTGTPRTSAPFAYTNDWGLAFACLLPFFLLSWFDRGAGWRRYAAPLVLIVAVYPVVQSQNRGLWIALLASGLVVIVRAAVFGSIRFVVSVLLGAAVAAAVVLSTPLGSTITDRLTHSGSASNRATLGSETLASVAEKSPVVGLGTTRPVQGSFYSIAGGDTVNCVGCSPPPLGTQGHFWLVAFSTGYGGLALYLGFIVIQLLRHVRLRSPVATLGIVVLVVHLSTIVIYDTIGIQLVIIFAAIGLLWRESADRPDRHTGRIRRDVKISAYTGLVRRHLALITLCGVLGVAGGLAFQHVRGVEEEAVSSVFVPVDPNSPVAGGTGLTMDTIAQLIGTPKAGVAVEPVTGLQLSPGGPRLFVTATRDSRVLLIHAVDRRAGVARPAAERAAATLIANRQAVLTHERQADLSALEYKRAAYVKAVATIDALPGLDPAAEPLIAERSNLLDKVKGFDDQILLLQSTPVDAGHLIATSPARPHSDEWLVAASSGLMLGFLLGIVIVLGRDARGHRLDSRSSRYGGLPVLARMEVNSGSPAVAAATGRTADALLAVGAMGVVSADDSPVREDAAAALDDALGRRRTAAGEAASGRGPVVLVAGPRTPHRSLARVCRSMQACTVPIAGVVILSDSPHPARESRPHRLPWHRRRWGAKQP